MFTKRIDRISESATLAMTAKAAELRESGINVINLSVGEPDFPTPDNIRQAGKLAIDNGHTKYTPGGGTLNLKKAAALKMKRDNNLHYDPQDILISCGGKHALYNACQVLFQAPDEVIIFSPYWVSFPDFVSVTGAKPIFVDVNKDLNINPDLIEESITSKTKAIIAPHTYGLPIDMDPLIKIAKQYKLKVIEDAAEAIGLKYKKKECGSFGDVSTFSFYANKHITTGEGGMIVTDNKKIAERCKSLRNICLNKKRRFVHYELGWNNRFTNLQSAVGLAQLEKLNSFTNSLFKMTSYFIK